MTDLEALRSSVDGLVARVEVLTRTVETLVHQEQPRGWVRTGEACRLVGVHRRTLYRWERQGLVGRRLDGVGEVVWSREELLRVCAGLRTSKA